MSSIVVAGDTSGSVTLQAPAVAGSTVLTLPVATDTLVGKATTDVLTNKTLTSPTISGAVVSSMGSSVLTSGTAVASTSGTSIDFTGIPSWAKRITVMFNGVSTSGTSLPRIQLGVSGVATTSGYLGSWFASAGAGVANGNFSAGIDFGDIVTAADIKHGSTVFGLLTGNTWSFTGMTSLSNTSRISYVSGSISLGGILNMVRITTVNGTDTFDAGSINIMYE